MKDIKFACADFTFPLLSHEKVLDLIALLDFQGVDIGLFTNRSHLTPESEFSAVGQRAKRLKKQMDDRGLTATDVYLQLSTDLSAFAINRPEKKLRESARQAFIKLIEYAQEVGADHITTLPGMSFPEEPLDDSLKRSHEELAWRVEQVKQTALTFGVEVHVGSPFLDPAKAEALVRAVPGLTLTLDYTHFIRNGYTQEQVDPLLKYASHFHARGAKQNRLQTSMAENVIDYGRIIRGLHTIKYNGWIGLEYIWIDWEECNTVDTLSETIQLTNVIKAAAAKL